MTASGNCRGLDDSPRCSRFSTTNGSPGFTSGTIGDKTQGPGTSCGLVEAGGSLSLALGSQVSSLQMRSFALDIETRKNLKLVLTATLARRADLDLRAPYRLQHRRRTGFDHAGCVILNCNAASSSEPNAGDRDNCRFSGNVLADKLVLNTVVGEMGLSGGAAGGTTRPSEIELTDVALLDCESQPNNGDFDLTGRWQRDTGGRAGPQGEPQSDTIRCELIPAALRTSVGSGTPQVQFLKDLTGQTSAAFTLDVTWPFEPAQDPPPPTEFEFVDGQPIELKLCVGTPVYDCDHGRVRRHLQAARHESRERRNRSGPGVVAAGLAVLLLLPPGDQPGGERDGGAVPADLRDRRLPDVPLSDRSLVSGDR